MDRVPYSGVSDLRDALLDLHGLPSRAGFRLGICEGPTTLLGISWPFSQIAKFQETSRIFQVISQLGDILEDILRNNLREVSGNLRRSGGL